MKEPEYCSPVLFISFFILLGMFIISIIMCLNSFNYELLIVMLTFLIIHLFFNLMFAKKIFSKMLINDEGVTTYIGKKVLKQLKWEDILDAQIICLKYSCRLILSNQPIVNNKRIQKSSTKIIVDLIKPFIDSLYNYNNKIPVPIKNLEKLDSEMAKKLTKDS